MLHSLAEFFSALFSVLARQLVLGFGLIAVLGLVLFLLQKWTFLLLSRAIGFKGVILWTGWLGTPIHELSHVLVGKLCGIEITEVKLWDPDPKAGVLGYVRYVVPPMDLRHLPAVLGTFFMGIAPLFGGALVLLLALHWLAPRPDIAWTEAERLAQLVQGASPEAVGRGFFALLGQVYQAVFAQGAGSWRPWLLLYVTLAVGSHLAPSRPDLEGGLPGLVVALVLVALVDAVLLLLGRDPSRGAEALARITGPVAVLLILATVLCAGNLALAGVLSWILPLFRRRPPAG